MVNVFDFISILVIVRYAINNSDKTFYFANAQDLAKGSKVGGRPQKPLKCHGTDEVEFAKCCVIPPFFNKNIALRCGVPGAVRERFEKQNVTLYARTGLSCDSWTCILKEYHILVNGLVEEKRFHAHIKRWAKLNSEFKDTVIKARNKCRQFYYLLFPMDPCEFYNYNTCYRNYIKMDCPIMLNSTICKEQKKFFEECREYF